MEHREKADLRAQMAWIAGHGQEGLGHGLKEQGIEHPRVLECEGTEGMGEGKHRMDIGHVEELRLAGREPGRLCPTWTLGAVPIPTGVVGDLHVPTLLTLSRVPSEGRGPADRDRPESTVLFRGYGSAIARQISGAILAHHVGHFESRARHRGVSRGNASRGLGVAWRTWGVTWR